MPQQETPTTLIDRQTEILKLLYRFRFLNRPQIQQLLHHKYSSRLNLWLNQLTQNSYIRRYFTKLVNPQAAMYSLGTKGRKYLISLNDPTIKKKFLDRVWREHLLSFQTKKHYLQVADLYLSVLALSENKAAKLDFYTKTELQNIKHIILPLPDAYFAIKEDSGLTNRYLVEIIDDFPARESLIKLIWNYFAYYSKGYWQAYAKKPFPNIIIVTPDSRTSKMVYRLIQYKLKTEPKLRLLLLKRQDVVMLGTKTNLLTLVTTDLGRQTQGPAARLFY